MHLGGVRAEGHPCIHSGNVDASVWECVCACMCVGVHASACGGVHPWGACVHEKRACGGVGDLSP